MQIHVDTGHSIDGNEAMVSATTDTAAHDIRCTLDARLAGRQPIAVTHHTGMKAMR
ncbi:MAG: hypothetical protein ABIT20_13910 [Gemmatimonadaceae bacterium]